MYDCVYYLFIYLLVSEDCDAVVSVDCCSPWVVWWMPSCRLTRPSV